MTGEVPASVQDIYDEVLRRNPGETEFHQAVREVLESLGPSCSSSTPSTPTSKIDRADLRAGAADHLPGAVEDDPARCTSTAASGSSSTPRSAPTRAACASTRRSTWASSSSSASSRSSRTPSPACRSAAARAAPTSTPRAAPTPRSCGSASRFMTELYRHIGEYTDVPAGDIGVGGARDRLPVRPVQADHQPLRVRRPHRQGPGLGRRPGAHRGHRLRRGVLRRGDARAAAATPSTASASSSPARATWRVYAHREGARSSAARVVACSDSTGYVVDEKGIDLDAAQAGQGGRARPDRPTTPSARRQRALRRRTAASGTSPCDVALPMRHAERARRRDGRDAGPQRLRGTSPRARTCRPPPSAVALFRTAGIALRPGQGGQRRRRGDLGAGDAAERLPRLGGASSTARPGSRRSCGASTPAATRPPNEYGSPGDYVLGANIAGFLQVADAMHAHGLI